jgi:CRP/FNR family transcriptional regulator
MRDIKKGDTFIAEGTPATDFFNITRGTVKLFKLLPDGRQQVTGFAGIGHFLGLAVSDTYAFSAEAIEPVQLCRFSRPKLREVLHDFPALEERLLQTACNELVAAQEQMLLLGRKNARERVATFLVAQCHATLPCGPAELVPLPMTRSEIADYLGLTIETVSRTFSRFKAEKRIATPSNSEVVILDRAWLDHMASGYA